MHLNLNDRTTQVGLAIVALGFIALLGNLDIFHGLDALVVTALFGAAGVAVLRIHRRNPRRLWTLPVGFGLLGLAAATLGLSWAGGAFLGSIGLGFLAIWLTDPERTRWWALIPSGALLSLGAVASWDALSRGPSDLGGAIFLLGLAGTFAALYLLPSVQQRWAIWPALGLGILAAASLSFGGGWLSPIALIVVGAWLLLRQNGTSLA